MSGPLSVQLHVLVVEDDPDLRELLVVLLRQEGYLVTSVCSLEHAMELLEEHTFHFILSDAFSEALNDPLASVEALRDCAWPIPVAVMTAWNISEDVAKQRGFSCLIRKPFDIDYLSATIATTLNTPLTSQQQLNQARIIERFYAALNSHDGATAASFCTEDFMYFSGAPRTNSPQVQVKGGEPYRVYLEEIFRSYPNLQVEMGSIAAYPRGLAVHHAIRYEGTDGSPRHRVTGVVFAFAGEQIAQLGQKSVMQQLLSESKPSS